jgi:hypothetical protein
MNHITAFLVGYVLTQTCIVPAPPVPPTPTQATVTFPVDGGTQGCTFTAFTPGGAQSNTYSVSNAKCATMVAMAKQAAANDNGWNDGGAP